MNKPETAVKHRISTRVLSLILAMLTLMGAASMTVFSAASKTENDKETNINTETNTNNELEYIYDELSISMDGTETYDIELYEYEKKTIKAEGVLAEKYQWQILHPEKSGLWVDIYEETKEALDVSVALTGNMEDEDGKSYVRCIAYTTDGAYVTDPASISFAEAKEPDFTMPQLNVTDHKTPVSHADGDGTESEFVTIQIDYIRYAYVKKLDGSIVKEEVGSAFTSYVAMLKSGGVLDAENGIVENPTIVGFDSFLYKGEDANGDPILEKCDGVVVSQEPKYADEYYEVQYHPALVDYEVHYYFQNIYDDLYVEDSAIQAMIPAKGYTGQHPDEAYVEKEIPGFTSLYYEPETIAADGSTVFNVYYERNYYLMEFDCNSGYGADTLYVRQGTYISVPNPVRMGYEFAGWNKGEVQYDANGNPLKDSEGRVVIKYEQDFDPENPEAFTPATLPKTMPIGNTCYRAEWKYVTTYYTIVYWAENANDGFYSYWDDKQIKGVRSATELSPLTVANEHSATNENLTDAAYFTLNDEKTVASNPTTIIVEGNGSTVINVYYTRNVYTLTFKVNDSDDFKGCAMDEHTHTDACNSIVCGYTHVHDENICTKLLDCKIEEHIHTDECESNGCMICKETEHDHSNSCCTLEPHTHDNTCCNIETGHSHNNSCCSKEEHTHSFMCIFGCNKDEHTHGDGNCNTDKCGKTEHTHGDGNCSCSKTEHVHNGVSCTCSTTEHTHSEANNCYTKKEHTHIDTCYKWTCGEDPHIHTDGCYAITCNKTPHTHSSSVCGSSTQAVYTITGKYQQDIRNQFPIVNEDKSVDYTGYWWKVPSGSSMLTKDKYIMALDQMPGMNAGVEEMVFPGTKYDDDATVYYYVESLITDPTKHSYGGKYFDEWKVIVTDAGLQFTYSEDFHPIEGFEQWKSDPSFSNTNSTPTIKTNNYFYYSRASFKIKYYNFNADYSTPKDVPYQTPLNTLEYNIGEPKYPDGIEPGAYEFKGWYTTAGCYAGTEVDWENITMPASDLTLYAKWEPVKRKVYFYELYSDIATGNTWSYTDSNGVEHPSSYPIVVDHGALLGTTYSFTPTRPKYDFVGWFYMDEDNKKRFAPDSMEVRRDLHLFAEWQSGIDTQYKVDYVISGDADTNNDGYIFIGDTQYKVGESIADSSAGHSTAGKTKTFTAKAGIQLYDNFKNLPLFPKVNSHSILMSEPDDNGSFEANEFTFEYVYDELVHYTVKYLDKSDNSEIHSEIHKTSTNAIVTEKFKPKEGYIPEKFYIQKVLAADGDSETTIEENVIIFYYIKDTKHGVYTVRHFKEKLDGTYELAQSEIGTADINKNHTVTIDPNKHSGFNYLRAEIIVYNGDGDESERYETTATTVTETITQGGLEINIYYDRIPYPYAIKFMQYGTTNLLGYGLLNTDGSIATNTDGTPKVFTLDEVTAAANKQDFGKTISYEAPDTIVNGDMTYLLRAENDGVRTLEIRKEADGATYNALEANNLIFWYDVKVTPIEYHIVCTVPDLGGFNAITINGETPTNTKAIMGSTATPGTGFTFAGWFEDENCTVPIQTTHPDWLETLSDGISVKLKPKQFKENPTDPNGVNHYYAKFEPICGSMTLSKALKDGSDPARKFIFNIKGSNNNNKHIDLYVTIEGAGNVNINDLPIGDYTVKELTDWSWDYNAEGSSAQTVTIEKDTKKTVSFSNDKSDANWLSGETSEDNLFTNN